MLATLPLCQSLQKLLPPNHWRVMVLWSPADPAASAGQSLHAWPPTAPPLCLPMPPTTAAKNLIAEIAAQGGWARALQLDLADPDQFSQVFADVDQAFCDAGVDGLTVLVANAGIIAHAPIDQLTVADWDQMIATNARGTFLTLQHSAQRLRDNGRIITISTIGTSWPSPGDAAYAASKAAAEQITRVASRELGHRGITANTISGGPTDTDLLRSGAPPEARDGAAAMTALGRIGQPADVADLAALIASPDSRWITGQNIHADGGLT